MKLLIITQKVDNQDSILGFFHRWIEEFAKHCEQIVVICLEKGEYNLPSNVRVLSLGKEGRQSRAKYLNNFLKYIHQEKDNYDVVFVHMNPIYVVLGGLFWSIWHKKIALWYTHKSVDLKLRLAEKLSDVVFTASKDSFCLKSNKVIVTGHGIDTDEFRVKSSEFGDTKDEFNILSVGRLSIIKNQLLLVKFFKNIKDQTQKKIKLTIIGGPVTNKDKEYEKEIRDYVMQNGFFDSVKFVGAISQDRMVGYYSQSNLLINLSHTGSMDKDVLEAASCNIDILTSNKAYQDELPLENTVEFDEQKIKEKLIKKIEHPEEVFLRKLIQEKHSLPNLIQKIISKL